MYLGSKLVLVFVRLDLVDIGFVDSVNLDLVGNNMTYYEIHYSKSTIISNSIIKLKNIFIWYGILVLL